MKVIAVSKHAPAQQLAGDRVELVDMGELCARADIVSLHAIPGRYHRFGTARINALQPGAMIMNTASSSLLDEDALIAALRNGRLSAAAIDAFLPEPPPDDSPLFACPNLILTPHVGGAACEALNTPPSLRRKRCSRPSASPDRDRFPAPNSSMRRHGSCRRIRRHD